MAMDERRLLARRPFSGLGGAQSQALLSFDQGTLSQIKAALQGQPVAGNPFPNATPQQLALALAGSTPWQPWNQSGTIDKAIANTVAKFSSVGGSDQILRSLQIAAGMVSGTPQVTVGASTPGVKVTQDAATTAAMKSGIAALLGVGVPTSGAPLPGNGTAPPTVTVSSSSGTAAVPLSALTPTPGAPATSGAVAPPSLNCSAMGMSTSADGLTCVPAVSAGGSVPLSSVLGLTPTGIDPTTGLPFASAPSGSSVGASPLATTPVAGPFDFLFAPITLPVVGAVPTWTLGAAAAAAFLYFKKKSKRSSAPAAPIGGPV